MVTHACNPCIGRQRQENKEFKVKGPLGYIATHSEFKTALWATRTGLKKKNKINWGGGGDGSLPISQIIHLVPLPPGLQSPWILHALFVLLEIEPRTLCVAGT